MPRATVSRKCKMCRAYTYCVHTRARIIFSLILTWIRLQWICVSSSVFNIFTHIIINDIRKNRGVATGSPMCRFFILILFFFLRLLLFAVLIDSLFLPCVAVILLVCCYFAYSKYWIFLAEYNTFVNKSWRNNTYIPYWKVYVKFSLWRRYT